MFKFMVLYVWYDIGPIFVKDIEIFVYNFKTWNINIYVKVNTFKSLNNCLHGVFW